MFENRSYCGKLSSTDIGEEVVISGWVDRNRDLGGIVFLEVRDVTGIVQAVFDSSRVPQITRQAEKVRSEFCVMVKGKVIKRTEDTVNPNLTTGDIEVQADVLDVLAESEVPPFPMDSQDRLSEEIRLRYRYLDLRRAEMRDAVINRHRAMQVTRKYLAEQNFYEIETPMLNKSTPEGARDFLVPSRINRGMFYALPQSPQLFKQILMVSGFDRYFQIVKCFRDEDLRNDRQPEFTQVDLEMSFVTPDMVMEQIEGLLLEMVRALKGKDIQVPFPRLTYEEAMNRYGKDDPDTRFGMELTDCTDIFGNSDFKVFQSTLEDGGIIKAMVVPDDGKISRKMTDEYIEYVKTYRAGGLPTVRYNNGSFETGIAKFLGDDEKETLIDRLSLDGNVLVIFSCDRKQVVNDALGNLREHIAEQMGMIDEDALNFLWVVDFPLLEYDHEDERFYAMHHPFTAPKPEDIEKLDSLSPENADSVRAHAYDVVLNGMEIGGGSIRINKMELQRKMFNILGISEEEAKVKFSFLLEALQYGAPPHGGIALGLDRILMILLKRESIREVIPFPKTQKGQCLMSNAPSPVAAGQLRDLSIKVVEP